MKTTSDWTDFTSSDVKIYISRSHSHSYVWTEGSYVHFVDTSHRQQSVGLWLSLTSCLDSCICCSRSVTRVFSSSTRAITLSRSSSRYALSCCPSTEESSCCESICQLQQIVFVHVCVCGEATQTMVATNKLYLHSLHSNSDLNEWIPFFSKERERESLRKTCVYRQSRRNMKK